MQEFIARQDCVITGHAGVVRKGDRIQLSSRAAKYPRLKGWIEPAPAPKKTGGDPAPEQAPEKLGQASRRRRPPKKD